MQNFDIPQNVLIFNTQNISPQQGSAQIINRQNRQNMKKLYTLLILSALVALGTVACSTDYNFDKVSLEMTIGDSNEITIPLGNTGQITLDSLLHGVTELSVDAEGYYKVGYDGSFEYNAEIGDISPVSDVLPAIPATTITLFDGMETSALNFDETKEVPMPSLVASLSSIPEGSALIGQTMSIEYNGSFDNTIEITLPSQVASIKTVNFGSSASGAPISLVLKLNNLANITDNMVLESLVLDFPAGFSLAVDSSSPLGSAAAVGNGPGSATNNRFTVSNYHFTESSVPISFYLLSADVSACTPVSGKLFIPASLTCTSTVKATVKAGTIGSEKPSIIVSASPSFRNATVVTGNFQETVSISETVSKQVSLPSQIARIDYLALANDTTTPKAEISLMISGSPVGTIDLSNLKITLPPCLDVEAPSGWTLSGTTLTKPSLSLTNGTSTKIISLPIKGIKNLTVSEGKTAIEGTIGVSASASVASGTSITVSSSDQNITITPTVSLGTLAIKEFTGLLNVDLASYIQPQEVDLSELASALKGTDVSLNLVSPSIFMTIGNPIGVNILGSVKITPYKDGVAKTAIVSNQFVIAGTTTSAPAQTKLLLSGDATASKEGYTSVYVDHLADIINTLPDKLVIDVDMVTDNTTAHHVIFSDSYRFSVDYGVEAGLKFGASAGSVKYTKTFEDVDLGELSKLKAKAEKVTLNVAAESTLPMDMAMAVEFLDSSENAVEGISTSSNGQIHGTATSTPTASDIAVTVEVADGLLTKFEQVKKIRCTFTAATLPQGGLKPDQYLSAKLSLKLDKGITIDPSKQ